jgi:hypothetical protein
MHLNARLLLLVLTLSVTAALFSCGGSADSGNTEHATLTQIRITPMGATVPPGSVQIFSVWGTYPDGSRKDVTGSSQLASSDASVAAISGSGVAQAGSSGTAHITARQGDVTASTDLNVVQGAPALQRIEIVWGLPVIEQGKVSALQFKAMGYFGDGSTQDLTQRGQWDSLDANVFTSNDDGLVTFKADGSATSVRPWFFRRSADLRGKCRSR